jgi:cobalt-precorrin-5B (C1)-methyltransferase
LCEVEIPLPIGGRLKIPLRSVERQGKGVRVTVVKDAGDDPDVTHKAVIGATVSFLEQDGGDPIRIEGGRGVGKVTRAGLPVRVGEAAINPVPRRQIAEAVSEAMADTRVKGPLRVVIDVEKGEELAEKTLNPRLGIVGGISILGTRGTVKPFSHESYEETIRLSLEVAKEAGIRTIGLSTGGRSEGFLRGLRPDLPETAFIQVADFFSFSLKEASRRGFEEVLYACFFGKLVKMAQGHPYTHAKDSRIDFQLLSEWCAPYGLRAENLERIAGANTAREALGFIRAEPPGEEILGHVAIRASRHARAFAGSSPRLVFHLFDMDGGLLCKRESDQ